MINLSMKDWHFRILVTVLILSTISPAFAQEEANAEQEKLRQKEYVEGTKFFQEKKYTDALKHYQKAAATITDDGECGILVGRCYFHLKEYEKALKQYESVAQNGKRISVKNKAQKYAQQLSCMMKGICPGNCLKPSMKGWRKMKVAGTPDRLVWMVYPYLDPAGKGGSEYWSNDHMGEVIEYVNGRPKNMGKCPICNGTGKITLTK